MPSTVVEDLTTGAPFTDEVPAVSLPVGASAGVPSNRPPVPLSSFYLTPEQKKAFAANGTPLPPPAPGEPTTPADPFAGETQVAKIDPFAGEQQVGQDPFAGERQADALDLRSVEDLAADPKFKIHDFVFKNRDNIFSDPKRYQKALDTYRTAQENGATLKKTVESVKTGTMPLLKDIVKSLPKRLENISDIAVAPLVNAVAQKFTGGSVDKENRAAWEDMTEDDKQKAIAEAVAGTQTAVGSLQDMMRQGTRKLVGPAFEFGGKKSWKDLTDAQLKNEFFKDLGWRETVENLAQGEGAKDLVDKGVKLDPENIKLLSLTDPITLVATGGALKGVTAGGRILFTAADQAGATAAMNWLGQKAGQAAAKSAQLAGQGAEAVGRGVSGLAHVPSLTVAGVASGHTVKALAAAAAAKSVGKVIQVGGRLLREAGEAGGAIPSGQLALNLGDTAGAKILNAAKTAAAIAKPPVVGAVKGAASAAPLAFATDEPQGGLLGVGAVLGGVHGTVSGIHGAVSEAGAKRYFDPGQITWEKTESPGYDNFSALNQAHEQATAAAPENTRNMVNSLRETLRPFDRKLFLVDDASYRQALENDAIRENHGQPLSDEQKASLDQEAKTRGISKIYVADDQGAGEMVTLVRSSEAAPHEFSHVLESLMAPDARKTLHEAVIKNYSESERQGLKDFYEKQTGRKMTADDVESEFLADNWANLLYNTPLENLGLPEPKPRLRDTLLRTAMSLGEQLGVNMSGGRATPGLGVRPSFNLRQALVDATSKLLDERNERAAQGPQQTPAPQPTVAPAAPAAPVSVPPEAVKPAAASAAPAPTRVRTKQEQHTDLAAAKAATTNTDLPTAWAAKQTPEVQGTVATINKALDEGGAVSVVHSGAVSEVPNAGETVRAAEVEAGRGRTEGELHAKDFFPTRWETVKSTGEPILIARSVDKVLSNVDRAVPMMKAAGEKVPWATDAEGNLTPEGRTALLADLKTYWLNQDAGHRGGGGLFVRPEEVGQTLGESLPERKGAGAPLDSDPATNDAKEQFLNMVQGKDLGPPETVREVKGQKPKNILAQELQVMQKVPGRTPEAVAGLPVREFKSGGEIKEVNPLRNRLRAVKQPVNELETITERVKASDITSAEARPELPGRGGSTDITRGGFLTDQPVDKTIDDVMKATPDEWQQFFGPKATLTGEAFRIGLGLKSKDELAALRAAQERASNDATASMAKVKGGNFDALDEASANATKAQFFREAVEAATDTGSAAGPAGWRRAFPESKAPFAGESAKGAFLPEANPNIQSVAEKYSKDAGIQYAPTGKYVALKPELSKRLADFYESAKNDPADPDVRASYDALKREVIGQYKAITDAGYTIEPYDGKGEPYKNSDEAIADMRDNKHLFFLKTEGHFAGGEGSPMLADSGVEINGQPMLANDIFRAVHDFFGHGKEGYQFGPRGEFNAWRAHAEMFSPEAQGALAAETLAQNSWVNYGQHLRNAAGEVPAKGATGYVPIAERPFAEQKATVVPPELIQEARGANLPEKPLELEVRKRLEEKRAAGIPVTEAEKRKTRQELEFEVRNKGGLKPEEKAGFFLPAKKKSAEEPGLSGWLLPNQEFRAVGGMFGGSNHEDFLGNQAPELNKQFGTSFTENASMDDRLQALNKGFVRMRAYNGNLNVELNSKYWNGKVKSALLNRVQDNLDEVNNFRVTLLNDKGETIDTHSENLFTADDAADAAQKVVDSVRAGASKRGAYLPPPGTPEFDSYVEDRIKESKKFLEALPLDFRKDENGSYKGGFNGEPVPVAQEYNLLDTPLAKQSKGKTAAETEDRYTTALSKLLEKEYAKAKENPNVATGETWYSTCREKLQDLLGDDTKFFAELLGATSAQTNVDANFGFALDAYNQFKAGKFDDILAKYREGKNAFANGELDDFIKDTGKTGKKATYDAFMDWWVNKNDLIPTQSNGKRYGMNSKPVLRVLDGSWLKQVKGPKTPNFTGNLTGDTFEATIDVWAARAMHRLSNEGNKRRWRIQPANETGVSDQDFFIGQSAFRKAAEKIGIKPDALQAILWFAEKEHWEKNGWTKSVGAKKSDYNTLLTNTERTDEGKLRRVDKQLKMKELAGE